MTALRLLCAVVISLTLACANTPPVEARAEIIYEENNPSGMGGEASADGPKVPTLRLPAGVEPTKYEVELGIDPTQDMFEGQIEIDLELAQPLQLLWLNGSNLNITAADIVFDKKAAPARVVAGNEDFIGFETAAPVGPGKARFRARYTGRISARENHGVFRQADSDEWYAFTHFEPFHARSAFPCFDEPNFKVPWEITLNVPQKDLAVSNGPIESETPLEGGRKKVKFKRVKMPSYLVAFAVGPFEEVPTPALGAGKKPGRILVPKGKSAQAQYAAETTAALLSEIERYFGLAYPYDKLDTVAVPIFGGAMENPGLITYTQGLLLSPPDQDSTYRQRRFASVQAHELAHMWFGDFVTMKWWDDTWLKESFSDWLATKIINGWKPEWNNDVEQVFSRSQAMGSDSLVAARPIRGAIETKGDIVNAFDFGITYLKGDAVLSMLEAWVGPEQYREGIRSYLKEFRWGNAEAKDFFAAISRAAGRDVTPVFSSFIDQPGVPLVSARLECKGGPRVVLSQKRYFPLGSKGNAAQTWKLPVCVRYEAGREEARECGLLEGAQGEIRLTGAKSCPAWVYPNEHQNGYYRSQLPPDQLKKVLEANVLRADEQVGAMLDLNALVQSGDVAAADALQLIPRLAQSESRFVVNSAVQMVAKMKEDLVPPESREQYQRFVAKTFGPRARSLGLTPKKRETDEQRLLRPTLVGIAADEGNDTRLQGEARRLAEKWLANHASVSPDLVGVVLNVAGRNADAAFYEKLLAAAKKEKESRARQQILGALGAVRDPALVQRNLELLKNNPFDPRESLGQILWGAMEEPENRQTAYEFLKANWDALTAQIPKENQPYLAYVASAFCDPEHRQDAEAFFTGRMARIPGADRSLQKALESVDLCIAVKAKQSESVGRFLSAY